MNDDEAGGQLRAGGHRLTPVEKRSASLPAFGDKVRHPSQCRSAFASDRPTLATGAVFYPRNRMLSKRVRVFIDWLVERFAEA